MIIILSLNIDRNQNNGTNKILQQGLGKFTEHQEWTTRNAPKAFC